MTFGNTQIHFLNSSIKTLKQTLFYFYVTQLTSKNSIKIVKFFLFFKNRILLRYIYPVLKTQKCLISFYSHSKNY